MKGYDAEAQKVDGRLRGKVNEIGSCDWVR